MQQLMVLWASLSVRRKTILAGTTIAVFLAVLMLGRLAATPSMNLLYSGLESAAAGDVVRALEQRGARYEVRGDSIFVESLRRDELRMTLASEGLPPSTSKGYELLDSLSGFGTTSQMFDAAYWRAKEGELARTIMGSPHVSAARVHIANAGGNPFQRNQRLSASVTVKTAGTTLSSQQVAALRHLVSSAVASLDADDVAVIDGNGTLLSGREEVPNATASDARANMLRERVTRLLEARVGPGKAIVEVSIDRVQQTESIREKIFDPEGRVAISTDTEERATQSNGANGGSVTVASNLPDGEAGSNGSSRREDTETRERVNYEVSEKEREVTRTAGAIRRLTVAVLVDGVTDVTGDGDATWAPRDDAELDAMRELVASAVGFDETRGDVITIKTLRFDATNQMVPDAPAGFFHANPLDIVSIIQAVFLGLVALVLGLFVVRPLLRAPASPAAGALAPPNRGALEERRHDPEDGALAPISGTIEVDDEPFPDSFSSDDAPRYQLPASALEGNESDDPVTRLRALIDARRDETVEILRAWMDDEEEKA